MFPLGSFQGFPKGLYKKIMFPQAQTLWQYFQSINHQCLSRSNDA